MNNQQEPTNKSVAVLLTGLIAAILPLLTWLGTLASQEYGAQSWIAVLVGTVASSLYTVHKYLTAPPGEEKVAVRQEVVTWLDTRALVVPEEKVQEWAMHIKATPEQVRLLNNVLKDYAIRQAEQLKL